MKKPAPAKSRNGYIGYARVSTEEQAKYGGATMGSQETSVCNLVKQLGGVLLRPVWRAVGESGLKPDKRPRFKEMLTYAHENRDKLAGIVFPSVDRATRNFKDMLTLQDLQTEAGIRIYFADNPYLDLDSAIGEYIINNMTGNSRFRSRHDSEKIKTNLLRVRDIQGRLPGHPPYGYSNGRDGLKPIITVHDRNAPIVQKIYDLYATGTYTVDSLKEHLAEIGIQYTPSHPTFSRSKLHAILRDRFYIGEINSKGEWYPGTQTPIVPQSIFDKVQRLLGNRKQQGHDHPYAGRLLKCAYCGAGVVGEEIRKKTPTGEVRRTYLYYRCRDNKHPRKARATAAELDGQIVKILEKLRFENGEAAETFKNVMRVGLAEMGKSQERRRQELQKQLSNATARRLQVAGMRSDVPAKLDEADWQVLYDRAKAECRGIQLELDALERDGDADADLAVKTFELSQDIAKRWVTFDWRAKRRLLDILWLNCHWNGVLLTPTWNKPFDLLAEGLMVKNGAEERT